MKCPFKDEVADACVHNDAGYCRGFCARRPNAEQDAKKFEKDFFKLDAKLNKKKR